MPCTVRLVDNMKKLFENKEQIVSALLACGYKLYGENDNWFFKKDIYNPTIMPMLRHHFHAIIDFNNPLLNLHIDKPRYNRPHKTTQVSPAIQSEMDKISNYII